MTLSRMDRSPRRAWPPGCWELDATHFPRPVTRFWAETFPRHFGSGYREGARRCAVLLDRIEWKPFARYMYMAPVPIGAPRLAAARTPPRPVLKLYLRVHPELRRRVAASRTLFERRPWREDLASWDGEVKPAALARQHGLMTTDPDTLGPDDMVAYLDACEDNLARLLEVRGRYTISSMLPVGDFLACAGTVTGMPQDRLVTLMRGSSPLSVRLPELERLLHALSRAGGSDTLLTGDDAAETLRSLTERRDEVGAAARAWSALAGHQVVGGYDIGERYAMEMPEQLLSSVRAAARDGEAVRGQADDGGVLEEVRAATPPGAREQLDELLAEARLVYRLRDERGLYGDLWAAGIMRRAVLGAGRALAERGRVDDPEHVVEASSAELRELLLDDGGPSADDLRERFCWRVAHDAREAPTSLGPSFAGPPPFEWLPASAARAARAGDATYQAIFHVEVAQAASAPEAAGPVRGRPVSEGVYEGTARLVTSPADFGRLEQGDVLVTRATSASFNVVLPLLGGIVTDRGGALSHAAIVAREYGIPAVVGCRDATSRIPDAARVRVSGDEGTVEVLAE